MKIHEICLEGDHGFVEIHLVLRLCCVEKTKDLLQFLGCLQKRWNLWYRSSYWLIVILTWKIGMHNGSPFWFTQSHTNFPMLPPTHSHEQFQCGLSPVVPWCFLSYEYSKPLGLGKLSIWEDGSAEFGLISMRRRHQGFWILLNKMNLI